MVTTRIGLHGKQNLYWSGRLAQNVGMLAFMALVGLAVPITAQDLEEPDRDSVVTQIEVDQLLKRVRKNRDYSGAGGGSDSAYYYYHVMVYRVMTRLKQGPIEKQSFEASDLNQAMIPLILGRFGYAPDGEDVSHRHDAIMFEAIPILASLRMNMRGSELGQIASDRSQNSSVRLACILSIFKAGERLRTDELLQILESEKKMSNRLITIFALGYGGKQAIPALIARLDDSNVEICTAAACALRREAPDHALPEIDRMIRSGVLQNHGAGLVFSALGDFKTNAGCEMAKSIVEDILAGELPKSLLSDALSAFKTVCGIDYWAFKATNGNASEAAQARAALNWYANFKKTREKAAINARITLENREHHLKAAIKIEQIRKAEYTRLLLLQVEEIVDSKESARAFQLLNEIRIEVAVCRKAVEAASIKADLFGG